MKIVIFCHSMLSDWNHGNAHFLRGVVSELKAHGHHVLTYEPKDAWSLQNLQQEAIGKVALDGISSMYPQLSGSIRCYDMASLNLDEALRDADLVIVHEWNDHELVRRIGAHKAGSARNYALLFHDTHHRAVSDPAAMAAYDLSEYDGVLAFGEVLRERYLASGWTRRAWTWHEAADPRVFHPLPERIIENELVWVGNWGDDERTAELHEFLLRPVRALGLRACIYGVRYPEEAKQALTEAGIEYGGWLPNYQAPEVFARAQVTVHVPRRPYVEVLPGIPTIRVFEALACGIPLISAPWHDSEHLFTPGKDFLVAENGTQMQVHLRRVLTEPALREDLVAHGLATIRAKHTCAHRVNQLMNIYAEVATT